MAKKTFNEKLQSTGDLPKVVKLDDPRKTMIIASPIDYDELIKKIPKKKLTTTDRMMAYMAKKYKAGCACPMTAGIFINIAAQANEERGSKNQTPWWRVLKKDGQLNEKFPNGIEGHKTRLEAEGHIVVQKGKRFLVENFEEKCCLFK